MRIAVAITDLPNYHGGPLMNMKRILPRLAAKGHEVHALIIYHGYSNTIGELKKKGIRCRSTFMPKYSRTTVKWLLKQIKEIDPDIFIPDSIVDACYAAKWVKQSGIPTINAQRGLSDENRTLSGFFGPGIGEWSTSAMVGVNHFIKSSAIEAGVTKEDFIVIPSGVVIPASVARQDNDHLRVVYVGRIEQSVKNVKTIFGSFLNLLKKYPEMKFGFVGDGDAKEVMMDTVAELNLQDSFKFTGALFDEDLHNELATYNAVVLRSDHEGMPGTLLVGMASGLVPVCTRTQGIEELIHDGENGLIAKSNDEDFERCIESLIDGDLRRKLAAVARKQIVADFSVDICVDKWESLCEKLIKENEIVKMPLDLEVDRLIPEVNQEFPFLSKKRTDNLDVLRADERITKWRTLKVKIKYDSGAFRLYKDLTGKK